MRGEGLLQATLAGDHAHELDLGAGQVDGGGHHPESGQLLARRHHVGEGLTLHQHVVRRGHAAVVVDAEGGRGVALGVEVDDEHALPELRQGGGHIDRGRRLADPALLVGHHEDAGLLRTGDLASAVQSARACQDGVLRRPRQRGGLVVGTQWCPRPPPRRCAPGRVEPVFHVKQTPGRVFHVKQRTLHPVDEMRASVDIHAQQSAQHRWKTLWGLRTRRPGRPGGGRRASGGPQTRARPFAVSRGTRVQDGHGAGADIVGSSGARGSRIAPGPRRSAGATATSAALRPSKRPTYLRGVRPGHSQRVRAVDEDPLTERQDLRLRAAPLA